MIYFLDTEFLEGTQKTLFGKTKPTIDLISIGIVDINGREFYAISRDFNVKEAWNRWQPRTGQGDRNRLEPRLYWLRENVLLPIFKELHEIYVNECAESFKNGKKELAFDHKKSEFTYTNFKYFINRYGLTNKEIADAVFRFVHYPVFVKWNDKISFIEEIVEVAYKQHKEEEHQFYAYFGDYDWVVFCWLFGSMMKLPTGFPMFCNDLKQIFEEKVSEMVYDKLNNEGLVKTRGCFERLLKNSTDYPQQKNVHNALEDAKWNKKFYDYLLGDKWKP
jgi:hypothetical protein